MSTRDGPDSESEEEIGQEDLLGYLLEALAAGLDPRELRKRGEAARRQGSRPPVRGRERWGRQRPSSANYRASRRA